MEFRNIKSQLRFRLYLYVTLITFAIFVLVALYYLLKSGDSKELVVGEVLEEQEYVTDLDTRKEGGSVQLQGKMYKRNINGQDYYAFFADDGVKYVVTLTGKQITYYDVRLGEPLTIEGRIQQFVGSIPYIKITE